MTAPPAAQPTTDITGRWTIYVCTGCGGATGRHNNCDAKREAVPVVPCDLAAQANAVLALHRLIDARGDQVTLNEIAQAVFTGARESAA